MRRPANEIESRCTNFRGAKFTGADFRGAKFRWLDYGIPSLTESQFANARFEGVDLHGADLSRADLRGANFAGAILNEGAKMIGARLTGADFTAANAQGADFSFSVVDGATFDGAHLESAKFLAARLDRASFFYTVLRGADLTGASLAKAQVSQTVPNDKEKLAWADLSGLMVEPRYVYANDIARRQQLIDDNRNLKTSAEQGGADRRTWIDEVRELDDKLKSAPANWPDKTIWEQRAKILAAGKDDQYANSYATLSARSSSKSSRDIYSYFDDGRFTGGALPFLACSIDENSALEPRLLTSPPRQRSAGAGAAAFLSFSSCAFLSRSAFRGRAPGA